MEALTGYSKQADLAASFFEGFAQNKENLGELSLTVTTNNLEDTNNLIDDNSLYDKNFFDLDSEKYVLSKASELFFELLLNKSSMILPELEKSVLEMQDLFLENFFSLLKAHSVSALKKIKLYINEDAQLECMLLEDAEQYSQVSNKIKELLQTKPSLVQMFIEIAWRNELLQNLKRVQRLLSAGVAGNLHCVLNSNALPTKNFFKGALERNSYQLIIKNEMAHFCFN